MYAAIDIETKLLLHVIVFEWYGTDSAAAFLYHVTEKYDWSDIVFLADSFGYRTAFTRLGLTSWVEYTDEI